MIRLAFTEVRAAGPVVALAAAIALLTPARLAAQAPLAAWVQMTPSGPLVRVVTWAPTCPRVAAVDDGGGPAQWQGALAMRAQPMPPDFPDLVCEGPAPPGRLFAVEGHPVRLRLPAEHPTRIVALSDSGCMGLAAGQDCTRDWFLPAIARAAAARQPDLVLHLGDYNYRGTTCTTAYDGCCNYEPGVCDYPNCGDSSITWHADFFAPAAPLLAAAPWVMTRGNHELCSRAGKGFFRYLDPHSPPPACNANPVVNPTYTDPYALALGQHLRLLVLDSANGCGQPQLRDNVPGYRIQFERLAEVAAEGFAAQTWLLTHRPIWSVLRTNGMTTTALDYTLQQALGPNLPPNVSLTLSGHQHLLQALTFADAGRPPALLVGTGGAELDNPADLPTHVRQLPLGPGLPVVESGLTLFDHGYLVIELEGGGWTATFYDHFDHPRAVCASDSRPDLCRLAGFF